MSYTSSVPDPVITSSVYVITEFDFTSNVVNKIIDKKIDRCFNFILQKL